ncbi:hypothetical protein B0H16DRAFT_1639003 [Mycena metata]|uniref:Uncharacterized protein n=1 Tax=Mycena metata TaxID=1033252 RepID=A0AAD7GQB2_9AGAR|nr:hypothetical protein B0H16DRAFT_1639003 [Mycena metata]
MEEEGKNGEVGNGEGRWRWRGAHRPTWGNISAHHARRPRRRAQANTPAPSAIASAVRTRAEVQERGGDGDGEMRGRKDGGACAGTRAQAHTRSAHAPVRAVRCPRARGTRGRRGRGRGRMKEMEVGTRVMKEVGNGDALAFVRSICHAWLDGTMAVYCAERTRGGLGTRRMPGEVGGGCMYAPYQNGRVARTATLRTANFDSGVCAASRWGRDEDRVGGWV